MYFIQSKQRTTGKISAIDKFSIQAYTALYAVHHTRETRKMTRNNQKMLKAERIITFMPLVMIERLEHHVNRLGSNRSELIRRGADAYLDTLDEQEFQQMAEELANLKNVGWTTG